MNGVIVANWPIALLIAADIVGIPLWMTFRPRHAAPDYREARAHHRVADQRLGVHHGAVDGAHVADGGPLADLSWGSQWARGPRKRTGAPAHDAPPRARAPRRTR